MPRKFRFTRARLDELSMPPGKIQHYVYDTECPGLAYLLSVTGASKFYLYKKIGGRPRRYPIADGHIPVDEARKIARHEIVEINKGNDPQAARKAGSKQLTLGKLFADWKRMEGGKRRSTKQYEDTFERYGDALSSKRFDLITHADVTSAHANVGRENGPYAANRYLAVLSILFKWARRKHGTPDPTYGVERFPEMKRERYLQGDELVKFKKAIDSEPDPTWKDFWQLLLATGARRGNVAGMAWADVDLIRKVWSIPGERAKGKKVITVPLSDEALVILKRRKAAQESPQWVFPSHSLSGHLTDPKAAWRRLLERAGLSEIRLHDIRRSVGSYMASAGLSDVLIGKVLGHSTQQATAHYAHANAGSVRSALSTGMAAIDAARAAAEKEVKAAERKRKKRDGTA